MASPIPYNAAELDIATRTVYGEARGESYEGKVAVAWVIRNRLARPCWWGRDIKGVCTHPWQFSCWTDHNAIICRRATQEQMTDCREAVRKVFDGEEPDPTDGASHYHRHDTKASWDDGTIPVKRIGNHVFLRLES